MLRTVSKKVGKTVELEIFPAPLGALHNNPPQRGGLKRPPKFRPERAMPIRVALPFQGDVLLDFVPTALRWVVMRCP
jgi:hypothetical protein